MSDMVKIVIDTMGGDNGPSVMVKGAVVGIKENSNLTIYLTGDEKELNNELAKYDYDKDRIVVVHASEAITCHDAPVEAVRTKKDSSLVVAMKLLKDGVCDAYISSGSTGAVLAGGQLIVGRAKGVKRTPLAPLLPTVTTPSLLIDCGANVDVKPEVLVQFAKMGSIYMKNIVGVENPRVAIVNNGAEDEKGNAQTKETFPLLKACKDINFIGSMEAREVPFGYADVIVCDAFVGNVVLKLYEGMASALLKEIKGAMMSTTLSKIGALLIKKPLKKTLKKFDATDKGGAPMLGLKSLVVKCHGNSKESEIISAIKQCMTFIENDVTNQIIDGLAATNEE